MIIRCLYDKLVPIQELKNKFHPKNKNNHPKDQVVRLAKILNYQGIRYCVKISKQSDCVTSGHGRILAAELNGWTEFPVNYQDYDTPDQEYLDVQSDNAIALWAEMDIEGIQNDLKNIPNIDIDLAGIKDLKLVDPEKLPPGCDEDEVPEHVEPKTKIGDLYELGSHRLLCGDSTSIDAVDKLMNGEKADMVFTDPPYGMNLKTDYASSMKADLEDRSHKSYSKIIGDDKEFQFLDSYALVESVIEQFWWGADYYCDKLPKNGSWIVWDKKTTEGLQKMFGSDFELCWSKQKHEREIARVTWSGPFGHSKKDDGESKVHPTMKAVKLIAWFFERFKGEKVIDLFGGSGSTLIACEKTQRKCFMMELDPKYCDVIVARWEKYSGKKAELLSG
jgi:DNA modification methylase